MLPSRSPLRLRCTDPRGRRARLPLLLPLLLGWGCTTTPDLSPPRVPPEPAPPAVPGQPPQVGGIQGRLVPLPDTDGGRHVVVYATREGGSPGGSLPPHTVRIGGESHVFYPAFLAVGAGQTVRFVNDDEIFHSVFSSSEPNAFDVGMLGKGEVRSVQLASPGVVRLYCSLHENESADVYVAPSPFVGTVASTGEVVLPGLPPGRYEVHTWGESIPSASVLVTVRAGILTDVDIPMVAGREGE